MLEKLFFHNTLEDWGISILIFTSAIFVNKLIVIFNRKVVMKMASKTKSHMGDILFDAIEKPVLFGVLLLAFWIATNRLYVDEESLDVISKALSILIVLDVTWFFGRFFTALIEDFALRGDKEKNRKQGKIDLKLLPVINRTTLIIIWIIGIITALNTIGIEAATLLGTLGIGGIAFALAAQDTIKNIFGGFTIFTDKTFRIGDTIKFDSVEGVVVDIGLRSTRIRNYDQRVLTIPNYKLTDAFITNISSEPHRRIVTELKLTYQTTPEQMQTAMQLLKDIPNHLPDIQDKAWVVSFTDFTDMGMVITFTYFIRKSADILETRSTVNQEIHRSFHQAGLKLACLTGTSMLLSP